MTIVATSVGSGRSTYRSIIPPDILPIIKPAIDKNNTWCLYLLECKGGSYYAGITNDLEARFAAHQSGQGARYTRANPPVRIIASKPYPDRSAASIAEARLKRIPRHAKVDFFLLENPS